MDWSKAKNILIAALMITNLILIGAIYGSMDQPDGSDREDIKENTILLLREHRIYVEEDVIPEKNQSLPVLSVRYRTVDQEKADRALKEWAEPLSESAADEAYYDAADELLRQAEINAASLVHQSVQRMDEEISVIYGVEHKGYSLDNSRLIVTFRGGAPVAIGTSWAEPVTMGKNKKQVMTASTALIKFMSELETSQTEVDRKDVFVDEIRLVYWLEGYTENGGVSEDTAVPYWCIEYNGDQRAYISAYEQ